MGNVAEFADKNAAIIEKVFARVDGMHATLTARIREISEIPSPTFDETRRTEYLMRVLPKIGLKDVTRLPKGSVVAFTESKDRDDTLLLAAHIDTVFPVETDLTTRIEGSVLHGPGTGDNAANLAAIVTLAEILKDEGVSLKRNLAFCGNVCEEGIGNLAGMAEVLEFMGERLGTVIAVDGRMANILNQSLAVRRYAVTARGPGGHSWMDFGVPSALHELARVVAEVSRIEVPAQPKTTFNVGTIHGGKTVNAIAQDCTAEVDLRSLEHDQLESLEQEFLRIVEEVPAAGVTTQATIIGERPAGSEPPEGPLVKTAWEAATHLGLEPELGAASTDAALPASRGIPGIAMGTYRGDGVHTVEEYVELESLTTGLKWLILTVLTLTGIR
ncbi:MAG: M20/M25/M40 family metallo-hydrolase [Candidatus Eisenbacteria bacterium]